MAIIGATLFGGCGEGNAPSVRNVVISGDSELEVSMWCADQPPTSATIAETDTEVRITMQTDGNDDCETAKTFTLQQPLGTRRLVDGRDGHLLAVAFDFRCQPSTENVRCDGIDVGTPVAPLS